MWHRNFNAHKGHFWRVGKRFLTPQRRSSHKFLFEEVQQKGNDRIRKHLNPQNVVSAEILLLDMISVFKLRSD